MWNQLMARLECCGVNSYNDFETSSFWLANKGSRVIPEACCFLSDKTLLKPLDVHCPSSPTDSNSNYMKVSKLISSLEFVVSLTFPFTCRAVTIRFWTISITTRTCWLSWAARWSWSNCLQLSLHSASVSALELIARAVDYNFISLNSILFTFFLCQIFVFSTHSLNVFPLIFLSFSDFSFRISSVNTKWFSHLLYLCNGLNCFN